MRTREELEALKRNWYSDPCWDIEDTEGFEEYADELKTYRLQQREEESRRQEIERIAIAKKAGRLQCSIELVSYIEQLENRVEALERKMAFVE